MSKTRYEISNNPHDSRNPSADDVVAAFVRAQDVSPRRITFWGKDNFGVAVLITGIEYESGTWGSFLIKGYSDDKKVSGYYNASEKKGYIDLEDR